MDEEVNARLSEGVSDVSFALNVSSVMTLEFSIVIWGRKPGQTRTWL